MAAPAHASSSHHRAPMTPDQAALAAQRSLSQSNVDQQSSRVQRSNGELLINHYRVTRKLLGTGQHGKVKQGYDIQNNVKVAIKIVKRKSRHKHLPREAPLPASGRPRVSVANNIGSTENKIRKEIAIMKKCDHHHVVRLLEVIDDPMEKKIYMVIEFMEGGEIKWRDNQQRPTLTVGQTRRTFRDVVLGLEYLHYQGIIHRDIKPANLLYSADRSNVKISDFGVSHFSYAQRLAEAGSAQASLDNPLEDVLMDESDLSKTAGSPAFFAPELCYQGEDAGVPGARHRITKAIDIWALGITLFCLLFGRPPLDADNEYQLYQMIPRDDLVIPEFMGSDKVPTGGIDMTLPPDHVGTLAVDMLKKLLVKDPTKRIEIHAIKRHPWVIDDVPNAEDWLSSTNPARHALVEVTKQEAEAAIRPHWGSKVVAFLRPGRRPPAAGSSAPQSSAGPSRQNSSLGASAGAGLERSRSDKSPKRTQSRRERFLHHLSSSHASVQDAAKSSPNLNDAVGRSPRPGSSRRPNEAAVFGPPHAAPGSPSLSERSLSPGPQPPGSPGPESRRPSRLGGILKKGLNGLRRRPKSELVSASMSSGVMVRSSSDGTTEAPPRGGEPLSADSRNSSWTDEAEGDYGHVVPDSGRYSDDRGYGLGLYGPRRSDDSNGTGDSSSRSSDYGDPRTRQVGYGGYITPAEVEYTLSPETAFQFDHGPLGRSPPEAGTPPIGIPRSPPLAQPTPRPGIPPHVAVSVAHSWDDNLPSRPQPVLQTHVPARAGMSSPLGRVAFNANAPDNDVFTESGSDDETAHTPPSMRPRSRSYPLDPRGSGGGRPRPNRNSSRYDEGDEDDLDESSGSEDEDERLEFSTRRPSTSSPSAGSPRMSSSPPPRALGLSFGVPVASS